MVTFKYRAFISYSHKDKKWGDWLHKGLERYRIPKNLIGQETRLGPVPNRIFPVFRDREELPTSSDLSTAIREALENSQSLIVICSRNSARSKWVNEEILAFKRIHGENNILAIIVDGEPNGTDKSGLEDQECFPPALRFKMGKSGKLTKQPTEPIAADARENGDGKDDALLKLIAGVLGVNFNDLKKREVQEAKRRARRSQLVAACMGVLAVLALGAGWFAWEQKNLAQVERDASLRQESRLLARMAQQFMESGNNAAAIELALEALPSKEQPRPLLDEAANVLDAAVAQLGEVAILPHSSPVVSAIWPTTGKGPITSQFSGGVTFWDTNGYVGTTKKVSGTVTLLGNENKSEDSLIHGVTSRGEIILISRQTHEVSRIKISDRGIDTFATTTDGSKFAFTSGDLVVNIIAVDAGTVTKLVGHETVDHEILGEISIINALAFSDDGKLIATAGYDQSVRIWRTDSGDPVAMNRQMDMGARFLRFLPDGKRLIVGRSSDGTASLWSIEGKHLTTMSHTSSISAITTSFDTSLMLTADYDGQLRLWEVESGRLLVSVQSQKSEVTAVALSSGNQLMAGAHEDGSIVVWDTKSGSVFARFAGHTKPIDGVIFSPDGKQLLSWSTDNAARIWNTDKVGQYQRLRKNRPFTQVRTSNKSGDVITLEGGRHVVIYDRLGDIVTTLDRENLSSVDIAPGGGSAVAWSEDGVFFLFNKDDNIWLERSFGGVLNGTVFSATSSKVVAVAKSNGKITFVGLDGLLIADVQAHNPGAYEDIPYAIGGARWSEDGRLLLSHSKDGTVALWNSDGQLQLRIKNPVQGGADSAIWRAALSFDGSTIAFSGAGGLKLFSRNGDLLKIIKDTSYSSLLGFFPNGEILAVLAENLVILDINGEIKHVFQDNIFDLKTLQSLTAKISSDGRFIALDQAGSVTVINLAGKILKIWKKFNLVGFAGTGRLGETGIVVQTSTMFVYRTHGANLERLSNFAKNIVHRCFSRDERIRLGISPTSPNWCRGKWLSN